MGNTTAILRGWNDYPEGDVVPSFDPMLGFPNGRKEREMPLTLQEMRAARIPLRFRDYCAHKYLELEACKRQNIPLPYYCRHERHAYDVCLTEDYMLRTKEYERERRLRRRQRKQEKAASVAAAAS
ncbi:NADH dehydrogenase (ubiquinone) B18 subunit [Nomia melanderi]|uniref:NADH dehydrogenase (ubiquinone) B18 subunit n=1 Tax=Nomia melanderi TaxID=2448451 RepID=UPI0013043157|nr:NADH dehydrogenase [ubiquinone] 1 beta subcomplex subunit 7 [Nomia melanderi]